MRRVLVAPHVMQFASDDPIALHALDTLYHAAPPTFQPPDFEYRLDRSSAGYTAWGPSRGVFGPARLAEAWAFLEWRATLDLVETRAEGVVFLHAAGIQLDGRLVLLVGETGSGKSTLSAILLSRGHRVLGDDLVRFATVEGLFSAVPRSLRLDAKSLSYLPLLARRCSEASVGTLLAASSFYISPAAIRRGWEAPAGKPAMVVLLDLETRGGPARLEPMSEGEAAVRVIAALTGAPRPLEDGGGLVSELLHSLEQVEAFRASGDDPWDLALQIERRFQ
jgi:hypothetical protein